MGQEPQRDSVSRQRVLDAAIKCILDQGFYRASSNAIAEAAGASWGVIQYHFGNRETLMLAVLEEGARRLNETVLTADITGPTVSERVEEFMNILARYYGSPDYLKKHSMPQRAEDLDDHRLIIYGDDSRPPVPGLNWLLDSGAKPGKDRRPILSVNNSYGMLRAVLSGLGLASLPDFVATDHNSLVRVLPELTGPPQEAYFVYPEELRSSKRISVFRDFLLRKVAESRLS